VGIDLRHKQLAVRDDRRRDPSTQLRLPHLGDLRRHGLRRAASPLRIAPIHGPVIWHLGSGIWHPPEGGPTLETLADRPLRRLGLRGEGIEAPELDARVAEALVRRHVEQAVGGDAAVAARRAQPVVLHVVIAREVEELDAALGQQQVAVGGLAAVAAPVVLRADQVRDLDGPLDLARARVASLAFDRRLRAAVATLGAAQPHEAGGDEQIGRVGDARAHAARPFPELLPVRRGEGGDPIAGGVEDHVLVEHQRAARVARPAASAARGGPPLLAGLQVEAHEGLLVVEARAAALGAEGQRDDGRRLAPPQFAPRLGIERDDGGSPGPADAPFVGVLAPLRLRLGRRGHAELLSHARQHHAVGADDLVGAQRAVDGAERLPCGGVEDGERRLVAEGGEDARSVGDHPAGERERRAPQPDGVPLAVAPVGDGPLPEQHAAERVAGDQRPSGGEPQVEDPDLPLVVDVEDAARGRHDGVDAGVELVAAARARPREPAHVPRRPDPQIGGDGVAARVVEIVAPLVGVLRHRLHRLLPCDIGHAAGAEHAHHLGHGHPAQGVGHDQRSEVLRVRQPRAPEAIDRHGPIETPRLDPLARLRHVGRVGIQAVDDVAVTGPQRRRQRAVAAAQMDDEPALDPSGLENPLRLRCRAGLPSVKRRAGARDQDRRRDKGS